MANSDIRKLIFSVLFTLGLGSLSGIFTISEITHWYAALAKPSFNPPNWLFGPVWSLLYLLMGISVYLVWKQPLSSTRQTALVFFVIQMALNFCWSIIFFKLHQPGWALLELTALLLAILLTLYRFAKLSAWAAWLLIPYVLWVSFALLLNAAIWKLNS